MTTHYNQPSYIDSLIFSILFILYISFYLEFSQCHLDPLGSSSPCLYVMGFSFKIVNISLKRRKSQKSASSCVS